MAHLLSKFRLNYTSLKMVSLTDKPQDDTMSMFKSLVDDFKHSADAENGMMF